MDNAQRQVVLPVVCVPDCKVAALLGYEAGQIAQLLHVAKQGLAKFVYVGRQGLLGGMMPGEGASEYKARETSHYPRRGIFTHQESSLALQQRMEQGDIQSTEALVKALNDTQDPEEQQALQRWIEAYIDWFNREPVGNFTLKPETVQEYSALVHIQLSIPLHKKLLDGYFDSVCRKAQKSSYHTEALLQALAYTLQHIDPHVFHGDPERLLQLSKQLLERLDATRSFLRATYPTYRPLLYALHQALVLIDQIAPGSLSTTQKNGLYQRFKKQLEAIVDATQYYPFVYHSLVLQQSLQRLASHEPRQKLERLGQGLLGALYLTQGIAAFMSLSLDIDALRSGCKCFQQARCSGRIKEGKWYEQLQAMHYASILSLTETDSSQFYEGLQAIQAAHIKKPEEQKALRFGILLQLSTLALQVDTPAIRQKAFNALEELTTGWADDPDLVEAMLNGFAAIATHGVQREAAEDALEGLINNSDFATRVPSKKFLLWCKPTEANPIQVAIERWMGRQQLEEKLSTLRATGEASTNGRLFKVIGKNLEDLLPKPLPEQPEPIGGTAMLTPSWENRQQSCFTKDQLFSVINSIIKESAHLAIEVPAGVLQFPTKLEIENARKDLQSHYQQYSHVTPLLEGQPIPVHSIQCQLMVLEKVKVKEKASNQEAAQLEGSSAENQLAQHQERLELVRNPIALEALFNDRSVVAGGPVKAIQRILLTGEAGTGKTTLTRKLAYLWAQGQWGQEFQMVYLLPIRTLQQSKYDNLNYRREETLATAVVNNCFAGKEEEAFKQLRQQVSMSLAQPDTLVLLDGLDERYGANEGLINQALGGKHKLLILSRPYGIEQERPLVGLSIEHAGFNDLQMEHYLKESMSSHRLAEELLEFLEEQPAMHQVAHVPVNLEILCALWQDDAAAVRQESKGGSLVVLYRKLTEYIWNRYANSCSAKGPAPANREDIFTMLGEIAIRGLKRGQLLISGETVREVIEEHPHGEKLLRESGLLLKAVGRQYQFPHLTFQEYFAGKKLAKDLLSQDTKRREKARKFLGMHKYKQQYGVTLSFLAGEVSRFQGIEGLRILLEVLNSEPRKKVGVQHLLLQLQCVQEWLCLQEKGCERDRDWTTFERDWTTLEQEFCLVSVFDRWFVKMLERVHKIGNLRNAYHSLDKLFVKGLKWLYKSKNVGNAYYALEEVRKVLEFLKPILEKVTALKEVIKMEHSLLILQDREEADPQLVIELLANLEQLLWLETQWALEESDDSAQEHLVRLRNNDGLHLGPDVRVRLTALLERAYAQMLKRAVSATLLTGLPNLLHEEQERLAAALGQLAAFHQEQGSQTGYLSHYTDAAVLYQHMLQVREGEAEEVYRNLAKVKETMIARCAQKSNVASRRVSPEELQAEIASDKRELQTLREEAKRRVGKLEGMEMNSEALYIAGNRRLFAEIAQRVGAFLAKLYQESEQALGPAPCKYTVIGLGSMALQQMTPYSDLEFAILMEDNESQGVLEEHREYFRQLSHLVHFRVINLGETVPPTNKYQISLAHLGKRGINFDLGGKTPLGRKDKQYSVQPCLIQPVAGMMHYLRNEGYKTTNMDKLLPFILERTCHVHGDGKLHEAYVEEKRKFFKNSQTEQGIPVYQARALQKLLEGVVEMDYSHAGAGRAKYHQQGDLADFEPKFDSSDAGRLYNVKQEIYRLPDRLLCRLAMYYGLLPESGWDAVDQLRAKGIISEAAAGHLGYAVSFAMLLRLRTYLHHDQQKDEMAVVSGTSKGATQQLVSQSFALSAAALEAGGSLFKYYYTALPLHKRMQEFFNTNKKADNFFELQAFYQDDDGVNGMICQRLMQYETAIGCYKKAIEHHLLRFGNKPDSELARSLSNLGGTYHMLGNVKQALPYFKQALEMRMMLYEYQPHTDLASSLNSLGVAYEALGNAQEAFRYCEEALIMYNALYEDKPHPDVAMSLNSLGVAYEALGDARNGLAYQEQALDMRMMLYLGNHPDIAVSLNNVGSTYHALGEARRGLAYQEQALEMRIVLYGDQYHPNIAVSLNSVGSTYHTLGEARKGLAYQEQALEMRMVLYGDKPHPDVAMSLNSLGVAYEALGDARKGLAYLEQALDMRIVLYGDKPHPNIAMSLNNVGSTYHALGEARKGLAYQEQALEMRMVLYPDNHPDIAVSLNNVGSTYHTLGEARKGLVHQEQALEMRMVLYGNKPHPDVAMSLNSLGVTYEALGDTQKAFLYCEQALEMRRMLYPDNHPDVAMSLNSVGIAYANLGQLQTARAHYREALGMYEQLFPSSPNHPEIQRTQNNIRNLKQKYAAS